MMATPKRHSLRMQVKMKVFIILNAKKENEERFYLSVAPPSKYHKPPMRVTVLSPDTGTIEAWAGGGGGGAEIILPVRSQKS